MSFDTIQSDPDVCNNCFRRTHQRYERNYAKRTESEGSDVIVYWEEVDLPDDVIPQQVDEVPSEPAAKGLTTVCACGYAPGAKLRPLPKDLFLEYAENLVDRYDELGIAVSEDRFLGILSELKSTPEKQFADDRLYRKASERVLESKKVAAD